MAIDVVTNEVAANFEEVAAATRGIDTRVVSSFTGGIVFGALLGFYFGYRFNREKIKAELFEESKEELEEIRATYRKEYSRGSDAPVPEGHEGTVNYRRTGQVKPSVEEIVEQRGYSTRAEDEERPLRAPVPVSPARPSGAQPEFVVEPPQQADEVTDEIRSHDVWNWQREKRVRNPNFPYIIHENEFEESESGYTQTTYTFYAVDNVLVDTDDKPLDDVNAVVGLGNLRFGHGSQDEDVVLVRNDRLELEMEITRVPRSYAEDITGLDSSDPN